MAALTRAVSAVTIVSINPAKLFLSQNSYTQGPLQTLVRNFRRSLLRRFEIILVTGRCRLSGSARTLIIKSMRWGGKAEIIIYKEVCSS